MKQTVLQGFDITWIPITGLVLFMFCFGIYIYFTYKKENKNFYDQASYIPLNEANPVGVVESDLKKNGGN